MRKTEVGNKTTAVSEFVLKDNSLRNLRSIMATEFQIIYSLEIFNYPTPVFLPEESQGRGSMVGCRLWGHTESDTTEVTWQQQQQTAY